MKSWRWLGVLACTLALSGGAAWAQPQTQTQAQAQAQAQGRLTVFISDLHMGLGRGADGAWHPYEDFRWSGALQGFLDAISAEGRDRVDLVILGDFLEFWQLPQDVHCRGTGPEAGCSVPELVTIARRIVQAHAADFSALRAFTRRGDNRLHIVPGNHDAALLLPEVWAPVARALGAGSGRVSFVRDGLWLSADGKVLAEHGQQIGRDVNRFDDWPRVTTAGADGRPLMIRPWGERFVQRLFNDEERRYPVIDNLSPESAGARYRMEDRGAWGSAADMARFIAFNIFETSAEQKTAALATPPPAGGAAESPAFDRTAALAVGHQLFTLSLPADDPVRAALEEPTPQALEVRGQLQALARAMSDEELRMLCDNALVYAQQNPCRPQLSAAAHGLLVPRESVFRKHLAERRKHAGRFEIFVFGHTHQWEQGWDVALAGAPPARVFNSGAFQRLVDEAGFQRRARAKGWSNAEALRRLQPEDLAPCYGVVVVKEAAGVAGAELRLWQMAEGAVGKFREPGVSDCR
jgi:UDP-2,3-diacylglucosamine pyrophosphatase LpxH